MGLLLNRANIPSITKPIIDDGNTVAWYIADDLTTITKDGSDFVSRWNDKLGSGHDLLQAVGANQPLWSANGVLFDGINGYMKTLTFTLNQPTFIYAVLKQITWNAQTLWDGFNDVSGTLVQLGTAPELNVYAGGFSSDALPLTLNELGVVRVLYNATDSKFLINSLDSNIGAGGLGANNMAGYTLGARSNLAGNKGNIEVKEILIRKIVDTTQNERAIYNYLAKKYSI